MSLNELCELFIRYFLDSFISMRIKETILDDLSKHFANIKLSFMLKKKNLGKLFDYIHKNQILTSFQSDSLKNEFIIIYN